MSVLSFTSSSSGRSRDTSKRVLGKKHTVRLGEGRSNPDSHTIRTCLLLWHNLFCNDIDCQGECWCNIVSSWLCNNSYFRIQRKVFIQCWVDYTCDLGSNTSCKYYYFSSYPDTLFRQEWSQTSMLTVRYYSNTQVRIHKWLAVSFVFHFIIFSKWKTIKADTCSLKT